MQIGVDKKRLDETRYPVSLLPGFATASWHTRHAGASDFRAAHSIFWSSAYQRQDGSPSGPGPMEAYAIRCQMT